MTMFCFLLMVSMTYSSFDQSPMMMFELFSNYVAAGRMSAFCREPVSTGTTDFAPCGHDVAFEKAGLATSLRLSGNLP